jgi:aminoglycoside/choline kinase family phosphotransferase
MLFMEELVCLFEKYAGEKISCCESLQAAGSNRQYYRLTSSSYSIIGVKGESKIENQTFIWLAKHFLQKGIPVPQVYAVSDDKMCYIQEDLGNLSLYKYLDKSISTNSFDKEKREMLRKTISYLPKIQFEGAQGLDFSYCYPQAEFDKRTIFWDLNYFKYSFLKATGIDFSELELEKDFERMSDQLLKIDTNTFLYRDFQSRNVMIANGEPYFIDFQGGRRGPVFYDIASFVWQAKANFPQEVKDELIETYLVELRKYMQIDDTTFYKQLHQFVLFRTLQVLGAYGFRGLYERKKHFVESIPYAIQNLRTLLEKGYPEYPYLSQLLVKLTSLPDFQLKEKPKVKENQLALRIFSFSYKKGIPEDVSGNGGGYVFDCRSIHNPGRYEEYKSLTGLDEPVIRFLEKDGEISSFLEHVYSLIDKHIETYLERGFPNLMVSFGCTGGQHRSVFAAQKTAEYVNNKYGIRITLKHREQEIEKFYNY